MNVIKYMEDVMTHISALLGCIESRLAHKPALLEFMVASDGLARFENMFSHEIKKVAKVQEDRVARRGRAFATGRDVRWPSKREQNS